MYQNKQTFRTEIDFEETVSIIRNDRTEICYDSLVCSGDTYCNIEPNSVQVFDKRNNVFLPTNPAAIFMSLPEGTQTAAIQYHQAPFNLYTGKIQIRNSVGLGSKASMWDHLATVYQQFTFYIRFDVRFPMQNSSQVVADCDKIETSLIFFAEPPDRIVLREEVYKGVEFSGIMVKLADTEISSEAQINLNNPNILSLATIEYQSLILAVKRAICKDANKCQTEDDLEEASRRSDFLRIHFPNSGGMKVKDGSALSLRIDQVFYVDTAKLIQYNIGEIEGNQSQTKTRRLELGLMFFRECSFYLHYSQTEDRLHIVLAPQRPTKRSQILWWLTLLAVIFAVAATVFIWVTMGPSKRAVLLIDEQILI
jgi:hypothetical protein